MAFVLRPGLDGHWVLVSHHVALQLHIGLLEMEHLLLEGFNLQGRALLNTLESLFQVKYGGLVFLLLSHEDLELVCGTAHFSLAQNVCRVVPADV